MCPTRLNSRYQQDCVPSGGSRGQSIYFSFPASIGHLHSVAHGPTLPSSKPATLNHFHCFLTSGSLTSGSLISKCLLVPSKPCTFLLILRINLNTIQMTCKDCMGRLCINQNQILFLVSETQNNFLKVRNEMYLSLISCRHS